MHVGALEGQKRESYPLKLDLQVLGIEMVSSLRAACNPSQPNEVLD